jgi:hypothetical protein
MFASGREPMAAGSSWLASTLWATTRVFASGACAKAAEATPIAAASARYRMCFMRSS